MALVQLVYEGDDRGSIFAPTACSHAYTYDGSGNVLTDTATDLDGKVRVKTYTYTGSNVTAASVWVQQ